MNIENELFRGFDSDTAKTSYVLNQQFSNIIFTYYANLLAKSSTPINTPSNSKTQMISNKKQCARNKMDHLFAREFLNSFDYDSGYTSLNAPEFNSNSSSCNPANNSSLIPSSFTGFGFNSGHHECSAEVNEDEDNVKSTTNTFCLSEDALLEKPVSVKKKKKTIFFYESEECLLGSDNLDDTDNICQSDSLVSDSVNNPQNISSVVNCSVETDTTNYTGFDDSNVSNVSVEIETIPNIVYDTRETSKSNKFDSQSAALQLNEIIENRINSLVGGSNARLSLDNINTNINEPVTDLDENMKIPLNNTSNKGKNVLSDLNKINSNVNKLKYPEQIFFDENNKENIINVKQTSCKATPKKQYKNPVNSDLSPELFDENDESAAEACKNFVTYIADEKYVNKKDQKLLKQLQNRLGGVLPPPSVTIVQISIDEILNKLAANKEYFWTNNSNINESNTSDSSLNSSGCDNSISKSLLVNATDCDWSKKKFPDILNDRFHGLHHNRSKISEELELLCEKYGQRCVGAETQSTCTVFESLNSPSKRKSIKKWNVKSPGRRLSHLARRRITFSNSSVLQSSGSSTNSRTRQILVDAQKLELLSRKKSPRKTPRKSPSKSPRKTRTPSNSAKKKLALRFRKLAGEIETTSSSNQLDNNLSATKRALFQSPEKNIINSSLFLPSTSGLSSSSFDTKRTPTKRALFTSPRKHSPRKLSPFKRRSPLKKSPSIVDRKRKLPDDFLSDDQPSKLQRSVSEFHLDSDAKLKQRTADIIRPQSALSGELSAINKKKLQWAVYEALRSQNIGPSHNQFKLFASILARVTRKFMPNLTSGCQQPEGSGVSERMLRIARRHVYAVIKGKSVDEIVNEYMREKMKPQKPQGYVAPPQGTSQGNEINETNTRIERIRKVINFADQ